MAPTAPLFSLPADGGAGTLIGMAAGDALGDPAGNGRYSAPTQLAVVLAYHLLEHGAVDPGPLEAAVRELAGAGILRRPDEDLLGRLGGSTVGSGGCAGATWVSPLGLWFRDDPAGLAAAAVTAAGVVGGRSEAAVAVAAAVAASTYGQSGVDLVLGVAETLERAGADGALAPDAAAPVAASLRALAPGAVRPGPPVAAAGPVLGGIVAGASRAAPGPDVVVAASRLAGPCGAVVAGAVVGARIGLVRWPWLVVNDMWFAEIGRRLAGRARGVADLPIPRAVEEHLGSGGRLVPEL